MSHDRTPNSQNTGGLPVIEIAEPCPMKWERLHGEGEKKFCDQCTKHVYNFSEMQSDDVSNLLQSGRSICARIHRTPDGIVVTRETSFADSESAKRKFGYRMAVAVAGVCSLIGFNGCDKLDNMLEKWLQPKADHGKQLMGEVAPPPRAVMGKIRAAEPEPVMGLIAISPEASENAAEEQDSRELSHPKVEE